MFAGLNYSYDLSFEKVYFDLFIGLAELQKQFKEQVPYKIKQFLTEHDKEFSAFTI